MTRKSGDESQHQTDVRYIRRHPKHDRFPIRRLGFAAVLLIAVVVIVVLVLHPIGR
jgi:hypothetical protein